MTAVSKRNILALLGLAPVGLAASSVQPENFTIRGLGMDGESEESSPGAHHLRMTRYNRERMAQTFEKLAQEVRTGGVNVSRFNINCDAVTVDANWLTQTLTIDLEMLHKDEPA